MIPKIIHYVWLGRKEKPESVKKCIESWKQVCPDYEIIEWNEDNSPYQDKPFFKEAYGAKNYAFSSDFIRVNVLNDYGGIYLDTDVELIKPLDPFLDLDFFCGYENNVMLQTAVIGSAKGSKPIQDVIKYYESNSYYLNGKPNLMTNVILFSVVLKNNYGFVLDNTYQTKKFEDEQYALYPVDYFCAKDYVSQKVSVTDNTYSIHYYNASWLTSKNKKEDKFVYGIYKLFGAKAFLKIEKLFLHLRVKKYTKILKKKGIVCGGRK